MLVDFQTGFSYFFKGAKLAFSRQLLPYVAIPILCSILLFAATGYLAFEKFTALATYFQAKLPAWLDFLQYILWPLFVIAVLAIFALSFTIIANFLASPFNGLLAEKAESTINPSSVWPESSFKALLAEIPRALAREVQKLMYYLPRAGAIAIASFIPGVNAFAPILWFVFACWMMAIQYCDYPLDNHKQPFKAVRHALKKQKSCALGFGCAVSIGLMVPILNALVMPIAICGACIFWIEKLQEPPQIT